MKKKRAQIIKKCEYCRNSFSVERWRSRTARFCSKFCKDTSQIEDERNLTHKICSRCQKNLPITSFYWIGRKQKYYCYCKSCRRNYHLENKERNLEQQRLYVAERRISDWASYRYPFLKSQAKRRNIPFSLTKDDFCAWYASQAPYHCVYCKLSIEQLRSFGIDLSIDRIDNSKGYYLENIALACLTCNKIKLNVLTYEDMKQIGQVVRNRLLSNHNCNMAKAFHGECPHVQAKIRAA